MKKTPFAVIRVLLGAAPAPEAEPEAEPERDVTPRSPHDESSRAWNLWDLERLAETMNGGDARAEERALLLLHLRDFADPAGNLPPEFDPLVREVFGADLAEFVT